MRPCTIDTSCLIALDTLGLVPKLSWLFSRVLIPNAVRKELFRRRRMKDRLKKMLDSYAFLEPCNDYDQGAVDVLLIERTGQIRRDRGEAEAIVQATSVGAMVIVDDADGRELAARHALTYHGMLWVLEKLFDFRLLSACDLREGVVKLRQEGVWLPQSAIDSLLRRIGEPRDPSRGRT